MTKTLVIENHDYSPVELEATSFHVGNDEFELRGSKLNETVLYVVNGLDTVAAFRYWDRAYFKPEVKAE